jgi:hypothetical protein
MVTLTPVPSLDVLAALVVDTTYTPGAASSTLLLLLERYARSPPGSMAATDMTLSSDAGQLGLESPSLPTAANSSTFSLRAAVDKMLCVAWQLTSQTTQAAERAAA